MTATFSCDPTEMLLGRKLSPCKASVVFKWEPLPGQSLGDIFFEPYMGSFFSEPHLSLFGMLMSIFLPKTIKYTYSHYPERNLETSCETQEVNMKIPTTKQVGKAETHSQHKLQAWHSTL